MCMKRTFWLLKIVLVYRGCWIIKCRIREGRLYNNAIRTCLFTTQYRGENHEHASGNCVPLGFKLRCCVVIPRRMPACHKRKDGARARTLTLWPSPSKWPLVPLTSLCVVRAPPQVVVEKERETERERCCLSPIESLALSGSEECLRSGIQARTACGVWRLHASMLQRMQYDATSSTSCGNGMNALRIPMPSSLLGE